VRVLCLGEAIVDLVCEQPVDGLAQAPAFVPRFGGAAANVAVVAARHGADVALAGGAGDDAWGAWLHERLEREGVALDHFGLVPGLATPLAFVTVAPHGEPSFSIYGDGIEATVRTVAERLPAAIAQSGALFFGSNTLVGERERELTMAARARALELSHPVVFDPNLRLARWDSPEAAIAASTACIPGAFLVKLNAAEALFLTGAPDAEAAARDLVAAGARMVVVTIGADGALLRGEHVDDAPGVPARVVSTVGAGDAVAGVLLARLALADFYSPALAAALPEAVAAGAAATERWGAIE
jgi:fructokinase